MTIKGTATLRERVMSRADIHITALQLYGLHHSNGFVSDGDDSGNMQPVALEFIDDAWRYRMSASRSALDCSGCCIATAAIRLLQLRSKDRAGPSSADSPSRQNVNSTGVTGISAQALLEKAKLCIAATPFSAAVLITVDSDGFPNARAVPKLTIADDLDVIQLTLPKGMVAIEDLRSNSRMSISFEDHRDKGRPGKIGRGGWLVLKGISSLSESTDGSVKIVVSVKRLEGVNYPEALFADGDEDGWSPAMLARHDGCWQSVGSRL